MEARCGVWSLERGRLMLQVVHRLHLHEDWADTVTVDGGSEADTSNT